MKTTRIVYTLFILVFIIVGCAGMQTSPITAKQQDTIWIGIYNSQYDDTYSIMTNPLSTPVQKEIGLKKKAILTQI